MKTITSPLGRILTYVSILSVSAVMCCKSAPEIQMINVSAGVFQMGSPADERCREYKNPSVKETLHQITISRDFGIGKYEVTQDEFQAVRGYNPIFQSDAQVPCLGENFPAAAINWHAAAAFCNELSDLSGFEQCYDCSGPDRAPSCSVSSKYLGKITLCNGYRLPTEAEWEYSYRAGTSTALYDGNLTVCEGEDAYADSIAWYHANSKWFAKVGEKAPNAWGIYDMAGNVAELLSDGWKTDLGLNAATDPNPTIDADAIVARGCAFTCEPAALRAAQRLKEGRNNGDSQMGFRIIRSY